jgi:hypothetical protein
MHHSPGSRSRCSLPDARPLPPPPVYAAGVLRVLVDADNLASRRLQPVLDLLATITSPVSITASGRPAALDRLRWPENAELIASAGWQRADASLAESYFPSADPLLLITGDGDFALLADRHPGPVLVVSGAASGRLRVGTTVVDPATDGVAPISTWLAAHGARPAG